jgi:hypothetical protein
MHLRIVIAFAAIHCLLCFFVAPLGWNYLYSWDSPHWMRAVWALVFDLPFFIVFGLLIALHAPPLIFLFIPLNSLAFSWLIIMPLLTLMKFVRTSSRQNLMRASASAAISTVLLGLIAVFWIPENIMSQKEACLRNIRQTDQSPKTFPQRSD